MAGICLYNMPFRYVCQRESLNFLVFFQRLQGDVAITSEDVVEVVIVGVGEEDSNIDDNPPMSISYLIIRHCPCCTGMYQQSGIFIINIIDVHKCV